MKKLKFYTVQFNITKTIFQMEQNEDTVTV